MSNRQRALAYAASVNEKRSSRTQPDRFGKPKPSNSGPAFSENTRSVIDKTADDSKPIRQELDKLADKEHLDDVDSNDFKQGKVTGKSIPPQKTTSSSSLPDSQIRSAFMKAWTVVSDINIPIYVHDDKSFFIPMMFNIFEVLFEMESILSSNHELNWICPNFFSLPVRVYYATISIVCVYRAKEQSGMLSKSEGSWLRAFFRRFKDEQCPIAGPLVPIFTNIASVLPDDQQFDYVYPTVKQTGTYSSTSEKDSDKSTLKVDPSHFFVPSVTLIADMLKQFCMHPRLTDDMFDDLGNYVPFKLENGGTLGGVHFPPVTTTEPLGSTFSQLLLNPVLMRPLPEGKSRLKEIHTFFRRSRARYYPSPDPTDFNPTQPSEFTGLGENMDWFQICLDHATVMNTFFTDSTNLSQIPTTSAQSVTVECDLIFNNDYTSIPQTISSWYPDIYSNLKATFRSSNAELTVDQAYQAAFCLTNGQIPWKDTNGKQIGSLASGLREGSYWENTKYNHKLESETSVNTNLFTMLQTHFYDSKGSKKPVV